MIAKMRVMEMSDEELRVVALELMYHNPQKWQNSDGPTASEIARRQNLKTDDVKKALRKLLEAGIVRSLSVSPKRWKFDEYAFKAMD